MHLVPHIPESKCAWLVLSQRFPAAKPSAGHITAGQQCPHDGEADLRPMALLCFGSNTCPLSVLMSRLHPKPPQSTDKGPSGYVEVFWSVLHKHSKSISVLEITIETGCQLGAGARIPDVSLEKMLMCLAQHTELPPSLPPSTPGPIPSLLLATGGWREGFLLPAMTQKTPNHFLPKQMRHRGSIPNKRAKNGNSYLDISV